MLKTILVPLDGSELAERALDPALMLARRADAQLILLSVPHLKHLVQVDVAGYGLLLPEDSYRVSRQELADYLNEVVSEHIGPPDLNVKTLVKDGDEAGVIVDTATKHDTDLIVMSTHGRSGLSRWMLGSVTERVLSTAPCPVLAIRRSGPLSTVMITLDGSEVAEEALEPAFEIAQAFDSRVILISLVRELTSGETAYLERQETGLGSQVELRAESYLQEIAGRLPWPNGGMKIVVEKGSAASGILDHAERAGVDLIAMATHGRTGLKRWIYGSVSEKVLRGASCSVLICRPPEEKLK